MMFHGKLLYFVVAWFATIGVAFFLPNLKVFAADCNQCMFCETLNYIATYDNGTVFINTGYFDARTGISSPQACLGGACDDSSNWVYKSNACTDSSCNKDSSTNELTVSTYTLPNFNCTLPDGATPAYREFNGGTGVQPLKGTVTQNKCSGVS